MMVVFLQGCSTSASLKHWLKMDSNSSFADFLVLVRFRLTYVRGTGLDEGLEWTDCSLVQFLASSSTAAVKSAQFTSFVFQRACCGVCWKVLTVQRMLMSMGRWFDPRHSPTLHSVLFLHSAGTKKASGVLSPVVSRLTRVVEPSLAHNRLFSASHSSMRSPLLSCGCSGSHREE